MGKNSNKRGQKNAAKNRGTRNTKNLEIVVTPPEVAKESPSMKPSEDQLFDDLDYDAEISMGAASPIVLQSPVVKMLGRSELRNAVAPTLVDITEQPPQVEFPQDVKRPEVPERAPSKQLSKIEKAIGSLDEFKGLANSPVESTPPVKLGETKKEDIPIAKELKNASNDHKTQVSPPRSKGSQSLDDLQNSLADVMAGLQSKDTSPVNATHDTHYASKSNVPNETTITCEDLDREEPTKEPTKEVQPKKETVRGISPNSAKEIGSKEAITQKYDAPPKNNKVSHEPSYPEGELSENEKARQSLKSPEKKAANTPSVAHKKASNNVTIPQKTPSKILEDAKAKICSTEAATATATTATTTTAPQPAKANSTIKNVSSSSAGTDNKAALAQEASATTAKSNKSKSKAPTTTTQQPKQETKPTTDNELIFGVAVVGFHHTRGPEVEYWVGPNGNQADLWPYLPFQSMPDGSHSYEENICYFTVLYDPSTGTAPNPTPERDAEGLIIEKSNFNNVETLFGISCTRQIAADDLHNKSADVTRSTVQKSLVVLARKPVFGPIKEKLKVVTQTYFAQRDFDDRKIIDNLYENARHMFKLPHSHSEGDFLVGTNPRKLLHSFGPQVMVMLKALLLEKKIAFYASDTEALCTTQFSLVSLIPDLLNNLQDCGSPLLSTYETKLEKPTFLRTSDRESLLKFLGLPLQVFAAGGMFTPFLPLQLVEELNQPEMQYGMFGSTNQVLFSQNIEYDLLVDIDASKVTIVNQALRKALELSSADKTFFNAILNSVKNTWDAENSEQPTSLGYDGSDDYIRHAFEDYLIGLVSCAKYQQHLAKQGSNPGIFSRNYPVNPLKPFNSTWAEMWQQTNNYRIFNKFTDEELFDIVEPQHIGLLKNRKRSDAISEVRGVVKEDDNQTPAVSASGSDTFSGKLFSMFGWSNQPPAESSQPSPKQNTSTPTQGSQTVETPKKPEPTPVIPPDGSLESTPKSPARKLFFWK